LHPIDTAAGIGYTLWDGLNAIGETVGLTTEAAKLRNQQRGRAVNDAIAEFSNGDSTVKTEMATKLVSEVILGAAVMSFAGATGAASKAQVLQRAKPSFGWMFDDNKTTVARYAAKNPTLTHKFANESELLKHFKKHGGEFKGAYQSPQDYLDGANFVIAHGHKVKYQYRGKENIGYVRFMGNARNLSINETLNNLSKRELGLAKDHKFGEEKFEFLAVRKDGTIATYHTESAEKFYKTLNQNKKNDAVNVEQLSCRMM